MEKKPFEEMRAIFIELLNSMIEKYDNFNPHIDLCYYKYGKYISIYFNGEDKCIESLMIWDIDSPEKTQKKIEKLKEIFSQKDYKFTDEKSEFVYYEDLKPKEIPF